MRRPSSSTDSAALEKRLLQATRAREIHWGPSLQVLWGGYGEIRRVGLLGLSSLDGRAPGAESVEALARAVGPRGKSGTRSDGPRERGTHEPVWSSTAAVIKWVRPPSEEQLRNDPAALHSHRRKLRSYAVEAVFYERYAGRCSERCRVPQIFAIESHAHEWLFVLEDLDAAGFSGRCARAGLADAELCVVWLARFHAAFMATPPEGLWKRGTYWHLATRGAEWAVLADQRLKRAAAGIDARLNGARFQTLLHGDAKLENFCFAARRDVAAVDFQYVGGGVGVKDVAYLLGSCFEGEEWAAHAPSLLDLYFRELRSELARSAFSATLPLDALDALEAEWRALYPYAVADFERFLQGWAPQSRPDIYSQRLTRQVLDELESST